MQNKQYGFTLIELLITVAIVGILAALALPSYQRYTRKAHYTELVQAVLPLKIAVEECYQSRGQLQECQHGKHGIPTQIENSKTSGGLVASITVAPGGIITAVPLAKYGINSTDTYIITPRVGHYGQLYWEKSGGGIEAGYAN